MKYRVILAVLVVMGTSSVKSQQSFTPVFKKSKKSTHKIPEGQQYTFGYLEVPENRTNPNGRTIEVPVYIFKSRSPNPKPDPIIYTVGGPGSSTMPSAPYMNSYKYLDDRDFILIEQRGNYYAKPHLDCPEWSAAVYRSNLPDFDSSSSDRLFTSAARACRERLTGQGIDLNGYNTNEIAADVDDLTQALNINRYNLLTISYSTKIAQVLLRDYPEKIRSVVMDSPLPLESNYDEESVGNLLTSLERLLLDCQADADCNKAYPDLKQRFFEYLKEKTQNPLEVVIENPQNGKSEIFRLTGADLITVFTSASTAEVSEIPFKMNRLLNNDQSDLEAELTELFQAPNGGAGMGMRLSVWCAEEFPFSDRAVVENETLRYPEVTGLSPAVFKAAVCEVWNVSKVPDIENEAVKSDIPVLLISGEYDNETPLKWAAAMKNNLSNSHHLIFKGWKHTPTTNWGNQCAMIAAKDFFNSPDRKPKPECFNEIKMPEFRTP